MAIPLICVVTIAPPRHPWPYPPRVLGAVRFSDRLDDRDVQPFRFDVARNKARALGGDCDWVLYQDTDMTFSGTLDVSKLDPAVGAYGIECTSHAVAFRSPLLVHKDCPGQWRGRTHEYFDHPATDLYQPFTYSEPPKTPEQIRAKGERDERLLLEQIAEEPADVRWRMYLGQTLAMLHRYREARAVYASAATMPAGRGVFWKQEQRAWCAYQAARLSLDAMCEHDTAKRYARRALMIWPWHAESLLLLRELGESKLDWMPDFAGRHGFTEARGFAERWAAAGR